MQTIANPGEDRSPALRLDFWTLGPRLALIAAAFWALYALVGDRLAAVRLADIAAQLAETPPGAVLAALGLTALSYLAVSFYDPVALRRAGAPRPLGDALRVGFTATALGQVTGFGLVVGSLVRWRMHRGDGMTAAQAVAVSGYIAIGFYLGLAALLAVVTGAAPGLVGRMAGLDPSATMLLSAGVLAGLAATALRLRRRGAGPGWLAACIGLAAADLIPAALALWVLLPAHAAIPMAEMLGVYMVALALGQVSNTPGGVGMFEATLLLAWPDMAAAELLAAILLYRAVYYGAPMVLALAFLADATLSGRRERPLARAAARLRRPAPPPPDAAEVDRVNWILDTSDRAEGALARLGDKRFAISPCGRAFLMYGVRGRRWIVMGDPHGPEAAWPSLWAEFRRTAEREGARVSIYKAEAVEFWRAHGLIPQMIGEEAALDPRTFTLAGAKRRELRRKCNQAAKAGLVVAEHAPHAAPMPALAAIAAEWSVRRRERSFSAGHFDPVETAGHPIFTAALDGRIVAFISVWVSGDGTEHALDLMRYADDAPKGAMHALVVAAVAAAGRAGATRFNLCMAPLSGLGRPAKTPLSRLLALVYERGERAHGFKGLRRFKESFRPDWRPRYVAARSQREALATLLAARRLANSHAPAPAPSPVVVPWERVAVLRAAAKRSRAAGERLKRRKAG